MSQQKINSYVCTLSEKDLEKAKCELNEDPKTRKLEVQTLRERLLRYPGLTPRVDDAFLLKFLRPKKFDQERTFELIINYYKMKKEHEDLYAKMTPRDVKHVLDAEFVCTLPNRARTGETVVIYRSENWDPTKQPMEDVFKNIFITNTTIVEPEETQVNGVRFINDLQGLNWSHATAFTSTWAQKMAHLIQDAFPMRVKAVHYVNEPSIFDYIFAMIRPFLKEKLKKRLHFHGTKYEELQTFLDPEHIPKRYGGNLPDLCFKEFNKKILDKQQYFEEETKFGFVSMTIKQESKKSADAIQTMSGTFKKLNVD